MCRPPGSAPGGEGGRAGGPGQDRDGRGLQRGRAGQCHSPGDTRYPREDMWKLSFGGSPTISSLGPIGFRKLADTRLPNIRLVLSIPL